MNHDPEEYKAPEGIYGYTRNFQNKNDLDLLDNFNIPTFVWKEQYSVKFDSFIGELHGDRNFSYDEYNCEDYQKN